MKEVAVEMEVGNRYERCQGGRTNQTLWTTRVYGTFQRIIMFISIVVHDKHGLRKFNKYYEDALENAFLQ